MENALADYFPQVIETYFDQFGDQEWNRLLRTPTEEVKLEVHAHYLRSYVPPQCRVLEIGAGPGRFTQMLADLGCRVVVADISQVQLDLNRNYAQELGFAGAVERWLRADICDLSELADGCFDAVVCYGGPLSYVLNRRGQALEECLRVTRTGGPILMSVMSLWGAIHAHLPAVLEVPSQNNRLIVESGDLSPQTLPGNRHDCHMFRAKELRRFLEAHGLEIVAMSASNTLATVWNEQLLGIQQVPEHWAELLSLEIQASREDGCLDAGTHLIAVVRQSRVCATSPKIG